MSAANSHRRYPFAGFDCPECGGEGYLTARGQRLIIAYPCTCRRVETDVDPVGELIKERDKWV